LISNQLFLLIKKSPVPEPVQIPIVLEWLPNLFS
jgi:hypothetical protein